MNLYSEILSKIPPSVEKDERRMQLFVAAVAQKVRELSATGETDRILVFTREASSLVARWAARATKLSFADLFRDPFKDLRVQTRQFAANWELDDRFRKEMG